MTKKEEFDNKIVISFEDEGIAMKGCVSKFKHVEAILALISGLVQRCDGDPSCVEEALRALGSEDKKEHKDITVAKCSSLEDLIKVLKEEIDAKKD